MRVSGRHGRFLGDEGTVVGNHLRVDSANHFLRGCDGGPSKLKTGPQQTVHPATLSFARKPWARELSHIKQRAKERGEEHHLRKDEPKHAQHIALM